MGKCLLPFTIDVEIRAYQNKAFPLGVVKANITDYNVWLSNKLINCYIYEHDSGVNSFDGDIWSENDGLTKSKTFLLKHDEVIQNQHDIINRNKEMLSGGSYILGNYDEFFIRGKGAYQKYHFNHDYVIFGYDDKVQVFKSAAYMEDGKYKFYDIAYEDYYNSIVNTEYNIGISYRRVDKAYQPRVDILHIKKKLENYLLSREEDYVSDRKIYVGMEAWSKLKEYVLESGENLLDNRYGRLYMEHRGVMLKRVQVLNKMGFLNNDNLTEGYNQNVYLPAKIVHYLFIKYNLTGSSKVRKHILEVMQKVNENEERLIGKVLELISTE